jgi:hypothetical protein
MTNWPKIHLLEGRLAWWRRKYSYRHGKLVSYGRKVENNKKHYPNHKAALKAAEEGVRKWGPLEGEAAKEVHSLADAIHKLRPVQTDGIPNSGEGICVPKTAWNPYRREIANWIARELRDAVNNHGARGVVTSGLRTFAEQKRLWELYEYHGGNIAARPGQSNHEGYVYSHVQSGAVDWSDPSSLAAALRRKGNAKLLWAEEHGLRDTVHFSKTGH